MCLVQCGYWELIVYLQMLLCPEKFLVINLIVGSKHIFVFCYFVIPIIGLKSFKSIVVLFALCRRKKWFYQYQLNFIDNFSCKVEYQVFLSATFIHLCFFNLSLFSLAPTYFSWFQEV